MMRDGLIGDEVLKLQELLKNSDEVRIKKSTPWGEMLVLL
jgi:hypothetical protein